MTRRQAIRNGVLFGIATALGKLDVLHAAGGQLTVDLDQWGVIVFKHAGKTINVTMAEVFAALSKLALVALVVGGSISCASATAPSPAGPWLCQTQERCSYPAPYYQRECRRDQYVSQTPCPATPIP